MTKTLTCDSSEASLTIAHTLALRHWGEAAVLVTPQAGRIQVQIIRPDEDPTEISYAYLSTRQLLGLAARWNRPSR